MIVKAGGKFKMAAPRRDRYYGQRLMRPIDHVARTMIGGKEVEPHGAEIDVEIVAGHRPGRQDAVESQFRHHLEEDNVPAGDRAELDAARTGDFIGLVSSQ